MDKEERPLTRDDFADREGWLRHCHEGGIDLAHENGGFNGVRGEKHYAAMLGIIYGQSRRAYEHAWAQWGVSRSLRARQLYKAYHAVAFANCLGRVLDSSLDITWSLQGIRGDHEVLRHQTAFLDAIRRWFDRNDEWAAYMWVMERGDRFGLHTHINLYIPPNLAERFRKYAAATLARIVGGPLVDANGIRTMLIQPRDGRNVIGQWARFRYVMKGLDAGVMWFDRANPQASLTFKERANMRISFEGEISVKRMGVSRALDDSARRRWSMLNEFPDMTIKEEGPLFDDRFLRWFCEHGDKIVAPSESRNGNARK